MLFFHLCKRFTHIGGLLHLFDEKTHLDAKKRPASKSESILLFCKKELFAKLNACQDKRSDTLRVIAADALVDVIIVRAIAVRIAT